MTETARSDASTRAVVLIGSNNLQNRILAAVLDERLGCACVLRSAEELDGLGFDAAKLVLLDIDGLGMGEMIDRLQMLAARASTCPIAIMNADERGRLDYIAAWPAIKGIFFRQTLQENLIKGIHAMFGGECWLPRRILSARWGQARPARFSALSELARLTPKEIETLKLLAGGSSNDAIARELKVSLHTVKTHVYNVFRKLNITNRVQAAHWALQHIEGVARD